MSLLSRLKRLWELSEEQPILPDEELDKMVDAALAHYEASQTRPPESVVVPLTKPTGAATVVQDNPLDIFEHHGRDPEHEGDIDF